MKISPLILTLALIMGFTMTSITKPALADTQEVAQEHKEHQEHDLHENTKEHEVHENTEEHTEALEEADVTSHPYHETEKEAEKQEKEFEKRLNPSDW